LDAWRGRRGESSRKASNNMRVATEVVCMSSFTDIARPIRSGWATTRADLCDAVFARL
jgi:hypothetical protein